MSLTTPAIARPAAISMSSLTLLAPDVQQAPEDPRERQDVVDLVRLVAAPRRHDGRVAPRDRRVDLGVRVRQGEHDRLRAPST